MIERSQSYKVDGKMFATLEDAQAHELEELLRPDLHSGDLIGLGPAARNIIKNAPKIIDILSTKATSKVRARRINGGTKTRTRKANAPAVTEGNGTTVKGVEA